MKLSLIILFLTILLLCGVLLRAAGNSIKTIKAEKTDEQSRQARPEKDMSFIPQLILL
jgi:hypothetical protein